MSDRHVLPPYSLRMPEELRGLLEVAAKQSKRSLNAEIIARLEESFSGGAYPTWAGNQIAERRISRDMTIADCFNWGRSSNVIRLRRVGSTHDAHDQLLTLLATLENITAVTLAVRDGDANLSALSLVIRTPELAYLADSTALTTERPPRESEVRDLIWALDIRGLLGGATHFRTTRIPQTSALPEQQAVKEIENGELMPVGYKTLPEFLNLFHEKPMTYSSAELYGFFAD